MSLRTLRGTLILVAWIYLGSAAAHGQSDSTFQRCPVPSGETDRNLGSLPRPKIVIDYLYFDGPVHIPDSILQSMIGELKQCEFDADSRWLDEVLEIWIRGTWQDEGYFRVQETARAVPLGADATWQHFSVTVRVDEGLRYRVGNIHFAKVPDPEDETAVVSRKRSREGHEENWDDSEADPATIPLFPLEQLRSLIPLEEGDILSATKLRDGLDNLHRLYATNGYIDFTPVPFTEVDDEHHLIDIRIDLDEQKQFRIGKLEVFGLNPATENALIWKIRPGDPFNYDLLEAFFTDNQSLLPAGASDPSNAELRRDMRRGIVDIKLRFYPKPSS